MNKILLLRYLYIKEKNVYGCVHVYIFMTLFKAIYIINKTSTHILYFLNSNKTIFMSIIITMFNIFCLILNIISCKHVHYIIQQW